jgi:hypothetical protein
MSETLNLVKELISAGKVRASQHGYNELAKDNLFYDELAAGVGEAIVVEDHQQYAKGPCVLVRQMDLSGRPVHVLWGTATGSTEPAVLVTAYRPDPARWDPTFLRRIP